jgi:hypothetical protein
MLLQSRGMDEDFEVLITVGADREFEVLEDDETRSSVEEV